MSSNQIKNGLRTINVAIKAMRTVFPYIFTANLLASITMLFSGSVNAVLSISHLITAKRIRIAARQQKDLLLSVANDSTLSHMDKTLVLQYLTICYDIIHECRDERIGSSKLPALCSALGSPSVQIVLNKFCTPEHPILGKKIIRLTAQVTALLRQQIHMYPRTILKT
jgi:hypothetical protein